MSARRQRGFALVAVLWMVAGLAALASAYALFAVNSAASAYLPQQRLRVDAALRAAVALAAYRQLSWPRGQRPASGGFSAAVGEAGLRVAYQAETARINVNSAAHDVLAGLFAQVGASPAAAAAIADRIVGWRAPLDDQARRDEAQVYARAKLSYVPAGAPFDNLRELTLLPGVSQALLARALPYLTTFGGAGKINPAIADPAVLAAIPGLSAELAAGLKSRAAAPGMDTQSLAAAAGPAGAFLSLDGDDTLRLRIEVATPDRNVAAEIVILLTEDTDEPYRILLWKDDFDQAP